VPGRWRRHQGQPLRTTGARPRSSRHVDRITATTNEALADIGCAALDAGKHLLLEKPAGRNVPEIDRLIAAAARSRRLARVGFNHRYHPALQQARAVIAAGDVGELMFVRGRYGHGGRPGYDREWRADPARSAAS
jgi:predicted dehydrogenase